MDVYPQIIARRNRKAAEQRTNKITLAAAVLAIGLTAALTVPSTIANFKASTVAAYKANNCERLSDAQATRTWYECPTNAAPYWQQ